jgi:hypothetical protein
MDDSHRKPEIRSRDSLINNYKFHNSDPALQLQVARKFREQYPILQRTLEPSEVLQWAGKPDKATLSKFLWSMNLIMPLLAVTIWFSMAEYKVPNTRYFLEVVFGLIYASYLFWHLGALKTTYCVTDRRIMWIKDGNDGLKIDSLAYGKIRQVTSSKGTVVLLAGPTQYHQRYLCGLGAEFESVERLISTNMQNRTDVVTNKIGSQQITSTKSFVRGQKKYLGFIYALVALQIGFSLVQFVNISKPHYAMFEPSKLEANHKYPLIIGFDAVGKGQSEVDALRTAAEKYKAFVIGVNDTGVGTTYDTWGGSVDKSVKEMLAKYPIDPNRIYISGYAAGGMAAYWYAEHKGDQVKGVIINTALMPYEAEQPFADKLPATYPKDLPIVMLASPTDKRYGAMKAARSILEKKAGWQVKWIEFPGGQIYAPEKAYEQALDWLLTQE